MERLWKGGTQKKGGGEIATKVIKLSLLRSILRGEWATLEKYFNGIRTKLESLGITGAGREQLCRTVTILMSSSHQLSLPN